MNKTPALLALVFFALLFIPLSTFAVSKSWNQTIYGNFQYYWNWGEAYASAVGASQSNNWTEALSNPSVTVTYEANVYNHTTGVKIEDGSSVPVGTRLRFEPKNFDSTDIYWFGTGKSADSPYGHWVNGATFPTSGDKCESRDFVSSYVYPSPSVGPISVYIPLSVQPPTVTIQHSGTATLSCNSNQTICTVESTGSIISNFTFNSTYGRFYYRYFDPQLTSRLTLSNGSTIVNIKLRDPKCVGNEVPLRFYTTNPPPNSYTIPRTEQELEQRIQTVNSGGGGFKFRDSDGFFQDLNIESPSRKIGFGGAPKQKSNEGFSTFIASVFGAFQQQSLAANFRNFQDLDGGGGGSGGSDGGTTTTTQPTTQQQTAPVAPIITGPTSGSPDVRYSFSFTRGSSTETRPLRFDVDWDNNGTADEFLPSTTFSSITSASGSYGWTSNGSKTFQARISVSGFTSPWKSHTISITSPQQVVVNTNSTTPTNSSDGTYVLNVPVVVVTSTLNAGGGTPPNPPTITGPTTGVPNTTYSYNFVATDPDGDTIRYRIDWDNNGTVDQSVPGSGYTPSGTTLGASRTWSAQGSYTFQARTQDDDGNESSWRSYTVLIGSGTPQCTDGIDNDGDGRTDYPNDHGCISAADTTEIPDPQCSDGIDNNGNGLIDTADVGACTGPTDSNEQPLPTSSLSLSGPTLVQMSFPATLVWSVSSVRAGSCTLSGTNGDSWNLTGTSGVLVSSNISGETTFTLQCLDLNGNPTSKNHSVKVAPSFEEI